MGSQVERAGIQKRMWKQEHRRQNRWLQIHSHLPATMEWRPRRVRWIPGGAATVANLQRENCRRRGLQLKRWGHQGKGSVRHRWPTRPSKNKCSRSKSLELVRKRRSGLGQLLPGTEKRDVVSPGYGTMAWARWLLGETKGAKPLGESFKDATIRPETYRPPAKTVNSKPLFWKEQKDKRTAKINWDRLQDENCYRVQTENWRDVHGSVRRPALDRFNGYCWKGW